MNADLFRNSSCGRYAKAAEERKREVRMLLKFYVVLA